MQNRIYTAVFVSEGDKESQRGRSRDGEREHAGNVAGGAGKEEVFQGLVSRGKELGHQFKCSEKRGDGCSPWDLYFHWPRCEGWITSRETTGGETAEAQVPRSGAGRQTLASGNGGTSRLSLRTLVS